MLAWLITRPSVRWVAPSSHTHLHNIFAAAAVQSGGMEPGTRSTKPGLFPFWQVQRDHRFLHVLV